MTISANYPTIRPSLLLDFANTKALDPRITFSRPTTATYYDNHTTVVAEQNLLLYSEQFDNANWTKTNTTVTANSTVAPDGSTTADTLTADGTANTHGITQASVTSSVGKTFSIYAKAGTNNYLQLYFGGDANPWADFDLSLGTVGSTGTTVTASIVSVGSGWYRCIVTTTSTTATNIIAAIVSSSTAARGESNSLATTVILWGAQLEQRSSVTAYTPTTTAPITNYIPALQTASSNQARFDHNPTTGESLGLLIEEQRTNLLTYSSDFSNVAWNKARCSITTASDISPEGLQTAQSLIEDTSTNSHPLYRSVASLTTATAYSFSVYAKPYGRTQMVLAASNTAFPTPGIVLFDISAGTVGTATGCTGAITSVGNGWYRCTMTITSGAAGTGDFYIQPATGGSASYTGNGYSGIYIWGSQLEAGAFATSYIPTVASQVTRSADSASMTGANFSSWYNQSQFSVYCEATRIGADSRFGNGAVSFYNANTSGLSNSFLMDISSPIAFYGNNAGTVQFSITFGNSTPNTFTKLAGSYTLNNVNASVGGTAGTPDTSAQLPTFTGMNIGTYPSGTANWLNGYIKKIAYYPQIITSAQLQALTGN